jgi:DNA anti-recombination protein RmuC
MNPQMNKVFSKLAKAEKTELASEKVELSFISDFLDLTKKVNETGERMVNVQDKAGDLADKIYDIEQQLEPMKKEFDKLANEYESLSKEVRKGYSKLEKEYNKIKKATKELGIDFPKNINQSYKVASDYLKRAKA